MSIPKRLFIAVFSAGWLVPALLGMSVYLDFVRFEAWPLLRGQHPGNSFPFLDFSRQCFGLAGVWLGIAIIFWSWRLTACGSGSKSGS